MCCTEPLQIHQCISDSGTESLTTHGYNLLHTLYAPATVCLHLDVADNKPCVTPLNDSVTTPLSVTLSDATELLILLILLYITMYFLVQLYKTQTNNTLLLRETPFIAFDQSP